MSEQHLTQAELFDVFSNARRRRTVQFLKRCGGSCELADLVEQVAAWENETTTDAVTRTQRRRVYISLYQTHLPMLEDHGIVDWNPDAHAIELLPSEEIFDPYLEHRPTDDGQWHRRYLAVSTIGVLAVGTSWVAPFGATLLAALALCLVVLVLACLHHVSRRPDLSVNVGS